MKTTKSEMKLRSANSMPEVEKIKSILNKNIKGFEIVDTDNEYWTNETDTLVIKINCFDLYRRGPNGIAQAMNGIINMQDELMTDEFNSKIVGYEIICRFWWD